MTISLSSTLSLISGPALLTNASAVLLMGATNRYGMARDVARRLTKASQTLSINSLAREARCRVFLLRRAMVLLQLAVSSFGIGTLTAVMALSLEETAVPKIDLFANPFLVSTVVIGGIGMIGGVLILFYESWRDDLSVSVRRSAYRREPQRPGPAGFRKVAAGREKDLPRPRSRSFRYMDRRLSRQVMSQ